MNEVGKIVMTDGWVGWLLECLITFFSVYILFSYNQGEKLKCHFNEFIIGNYVCMMCSTVWLW